MSARVAGDGGAHTCKHNLVIPSYHSPSLPQAWDRDEVKQRAWVTQPPVPANVKMQVLK